MRDFFNWINSYAAPDWAKGVYYCLIILAFIAWLTIIAVFLAAGFWEFAALTLLFPFAGAGIALYRAYQEHRDD